MALDSQIQFGSDDTRNVAENGVEWVFYHAFEVAALTQDAEGLRDLIESERVRREGKLMSQYAKIAVVYDGMRYGPVRSAWGSTPESSQRAASPGFLR